jgi:prepilin-type N-terminal cleavage/methylation domain-containing protein
MHKRRRRGFSFIEILVAMSVLAVGLMGVVNLWTFAFTVSSQNTDYGIAYNLGRLTMEHVHLTGFSNVPEGTTTTYYTVSQTATAGASASRYTVNTVVSSDNLQNGTFSSTSLRTVTVTVTLTSGGTTLYTTSSYLAQGGI